MEISPKSDEYDKRVDDIQDEDLETKDARVGSADVSLTPAQARALSFRFLRQIKRSKKPLKKWLDMVSEFPSYRGSLAGLMPREVGTGMLKNWTYVTEVDPWGPRSTHQHLWVQGHEIETQIGICHLIIRNTLLAIRGHQETVSELKSYGVTVDEIRQGNARRDLELETRFDVEALWKGFSGKFQEVASAEGVKEYFQVLDTRQEKTEDSEGEEDEEDEEDEFSMRRNKKKSSTRLPLPTVGNKKFRQYVYVFDASEKAQLEIAIQIATQPALVGSGEVFFYPTNLEVRKVMLFLQLLMSGGKGKKTGLSAEKTQGSVAEIFGSIQTAERQLAESDEGSCG